MIFINALVPVLTAAVVQSGPGLRPQLRRPHPHLLLASSWWILRQVIVNSSVEDPVGSKTNCLAFKRKISTLLRAVVCVAKI